MSLTNDLIAKVAYENPQVNGDLITEIFTGIGQFQCMNGFMMDVVKHHPMVGQSEETYQAFMKLFLEYKPNLIYEDEVQFKLCMECPKVSECQPFIIAIAFAIKKGKFKTDDQFFRYLLLDERPKHLKK